MSSKISVIILTYNESIHIQRCIESVKSFASEIFVVDSFSTDDTIKIAENLGVKVYQNKWINYAEQFNWGLQNCPIKTKWVMRMDADEFVTHELQQEILAKLPLLTEGTTAVYVKRRVHFMGKWIKRGGYYPIWLLRIWHHSKGYCEKRWMDEHIKVIEGKHIFFDNDIIDENLNPLTWWISKHNNYATREMIDILNIQHNFLKYDEVKPSLTGSQEQRKRWLKVKYANVPLFIRPLFYFTYRYFLKFGFMDGSKGLIWHFLQGFWYRFLVDAKIYEVNRTAETQKKSIKSTLEEYMGVRL